MDFIGSTKLADFLTPKRNGQPVNQHVVAPAKEPRPDFDAMQKVIKGSDTTESRERDLGGPNREIPKID